MQFTDKEIELARQMKEAGLGWKPEVGDRFLHRKKTYIVRDASDDSVFAIRSYPYDEDCEFARCYCTWLPLWHKCREIMQKAGYCLTDVFEKTINDIIMVYIVYFRDGIEIARGGHTDLEAIYKVILELLQKEKNNNE